MARLLTNGAETQKVASTAARDPEGQGCYVASGTVSIFTTAGTVRSGVACFGPAANGGGTLRMDFTGVSGRSYYQRVAFLAPGANPTATIPFLNFLIGGIPATGLWLNTDGTIQMFDNGGAAVGAKSAVLSAGTIYVVEMHAIHNTGGTGTLGFRIDGVTVQADMSSSLVLGVMNGVAIGKASTDTTTALRLDDWALNDDQGFFQASWPGGSKVVLLKPGSDSAKNPPGTNGWRGGAGGSTNLFNGVKNTPPVGVAVGVSSTDSTQIEDNDNNAADTYDASLGAYTTAVASGGGGMAAADAVVLAYSLARGGNSTTTSRTLAVEGISNPAITEITQGTGATAAGTDNQAAPVGWTSFGRITYLPTVTLGTSPVLRIRKGTPSTNDMTYDLMGLMVEYQVAGVVPLAAASGSASATVALAASTQIPLATSAATASATLGTSAQTGVALNTSAAQSAATLAVAVPASVPLNASAASTTASLSVSAQTRVLLGTSAATASPTLAVKAQTTVALGTSVALTTASLSLTGVAIVPLGTSAGLSSATLTAKVPAGVPLATSAAQSSGTLTLSGQTTISLGASAGQSSGTLAVRAMTTVVLGASAGTTTATATVMVIATVPLNGSAATSSATASLKATTQVPLATSAATASATLALSGQTTIPLGTSAALSAATLEVGIVVQYGRPVADIATTGWTTTPLWSKLDESSPDDADLVTGVAA